MAGLNKILVIGNLGTDPEMRYTPNGNPVTSFRLAANRTYTTSDGERREETEWFTIEAWNQLAELCNQYLQKGRRVFAEGRLKHDTWTGSDEQPRFRNKIIANQVLFLDRGDSVDSGADSGTSGVVPSGTGGVVPDEAPSVDSEDLPW